MNTAVVRAAATPAGIETAFFESSPCPMWICDPDSLAILAVNGGAIRQFEYSREEFLGMRFEDFLSPHAGHDIRQSLAGTGNPSAAAIHCRHRVKNRAAVNVGILASLCDFGGKRLALLLAIHAEKDQRPNFLDRCVLDSIPLSVLFIDKNMRVAEANRNFLEKSRRSKAATLGRPLNEVFPRVILEELPLLAQIERVFESGDALEGQRLTYRAPGVPLRTYYYGIVPIAAESRGGLVMLQMQDVTEQLRLGEAVRRVERHLASVAESASDILLSTDIKGRILTWNNAAERISGYSLIEVQERLFFNYCAEECREKLQALFGDLESLDSATVEYSLMTREGGRIPVSWSFSRMKDDHGCTVGVVAAGRDLTERRKLEKQLLQSEKLAALGVMAGGIAHEIRTPLAISSSAAQFLMEEEITEPFRRECAEKVHLGIQRAAAIIENLLRFARPSAKPTMVEFDLLSPLRAAIALVANVARIQKVEIVCDAPAGQVPVCGIAGLLEQVFLNLFLNALAAMPDGGSLTITVSAGAGFVQAAVADTGCGIAEADIYSIFDPFYTTAPVGRGTGLGLSVSYSIVTDHGGSIEVKSAPGKGSTFTLQLPVATLSAVTVSKTTARYANPRSVTHRG